MVDGKVVVSLRLDLELNNGWFSGARLKFLCTVLIILLKKTNLEVVEEPEKFPKGHKKYSIVFVDVSQKLLSFRGPVSGIAVAPLTRPLPLTPWVPQLNEFFVFRVTLFGRLCDPASS